MNLFYNSNNRKGEQCKLLVNFLLILYGVLLPLNNPNLLHFHEHSSLPTAVSLQWLTMRRTAGIAGTAVGCWRYEPSSSFPFYAMNIPNLTVKYDLPSHLRQHEEATTAVQKLDALTPEVLAQGHEVVDNYVASITGQQKAAASTSSSGLKKLLEIFVPLHYNNFLRFGLNLHTMQHRTMCNNRIMNGVP